MTRPAPVAPPEGPARAGRRTAGVFAVAGAVAAGVAVVPLYGLLGPAASALAVVLAAAAAAAVAALLRGPLVRAWAGRRVGRAALLGAAVAVLSFVPFAVAFSAVVRGSSWPAFSAALGVLAEVGLTVSPGLTLVGALAGALYARGGRRNAGR